MTLLSETPLNTGVRPIVKWAGGKRKLLPQLLSREIGPINRYFEPFLGGGAMMLALPNEVERFLCDSNEDLLNVYQGVRDDLIPLLDILSTFKNDQETYSSIRDWDRTNDWANRTIIEKSARFIYLNRTGFNGLHRVNAAGKFNVPFGHYKNPKIADRENLQKFSDFLNQKSADGEFITKLFPAQDFASFLLKVRPGSGDFVYLDPPYAPLPNVSSFVSYQAGGFGDTDQKSVITSALDAHRRGAKVMISNSTAPVVLQLFSELLEPEGFSLELILAARNIAAKSSSRAPIHEVVIRNF
jgi:DNA adenine methylase